MHTIARTYRAAVRLGEDFITIEETVTLPLDASEADVAAAVALGLRIYEAQREAVAAQVANIRASAPAPAVGASFTPGPASAKQKDYIASLQRTAGWGDADIDAHLATLGGTWDTMNRDQASAVIELLKTNPPPPSALVDGQPPMIAALAQAEEPPPPDEIPF